MSLAFHLSPDARLDLADLDPRLQEDVLDDLERLCADPSLIPDPLPNWGSVQLLARVYDDSLHVVQLFLDYDPARHVLNVLGVTAATRKGS